MFLTNGWRVSELQLLRLQGYAPTWLCTYYCYKDHRTTSLYESMFLKLLEKGA